MNKGLLLLAVAVAPLLAFARGGIAADVPAYFAKKAAFVEQLAILAADPKTMTKADAEHGKDRAVLHDALRALLGETTFVGVKPVRLQALPETLFKEIGSGCVDGLDYVFVETPMIPRSFLVTDTALVKGATGTKAFAGLRQEALAVICDDDAAFFLTNDVALPAAAGDAVAFVGYYAQDDAPSVPTSLFVATKRASTLYLAEFTELDPAPPFGDDCIEAWDDAQRKRDAAIAKYDACVASGAACGPKPSDDVSKELAAYATCYEGEFKRSKIADAYAAKALAALKMIPSGGPPPVKK